MISHKSALTYSYDPTTDPHIVKIDPIWLEWPITGLSSGVYYEFRVAGVCFHFITICGITNRIKAKYVRGKLIKLMYV